MKTEINNKMSVRYAHGGGGKYLPSLFCWKEWLVGIHAEEGNNEKSFGDGWQLFYRPCFGESIVKEGI